MERWREADSYIPSPRPSIAPSPRLPVSPSVFLVRRFARAGAQLGGDVMKADIAFDHQDQQMVKQIADIGRELFAAFVVAGVLGRDDRFGGFLADLLENFVKAVVKEIARIGAFRSLILSLLDQFEEVLKLYPQIHCGDINQRDRRFHTLNTLLFDPRRLRRLDIPRAPEEAGAFAGVTRRAVRVNAHQQRIAVAVKANVNDALSGARGRAFMPKLSPRTAPEPGLASLQGLRQTLGVHMRDHQDLVGVVVLHDSRDQSLIIELQILN